MSQKERKPKKIPASLSIEEFKRLIENTKREDYKLAFLLGYGSGLRVSEIVKLTPNDIEEKHILVRQGKGGKDRIVPLPKGFKDKYLKLLPLKVGVRGLEYAFKRSCKKAGLLEKKPNLHFHSLRHAFAYRCVAEGIPIHHVRSLMGHSNISTTNVYLESNPIDALKSYEDLF